MTYDFTTLSPSDFEGLIADLFSKEWNTQLEIFKEGKDGGVDLLNSRVPSGSPQTIVQCKRYGPDKLSQLMASTKLERAKLEKIKPQRYVLVTSVPLSKKNKDSLIDILSPFCTNTSDIYGGEEVNSLIRKYPGIEQSHFKLWISSTAVLERVLNAKVFAITDATVETTMQEIRKLVPHSGLKRALDLINTQRHVLIVGNPGIGKTTLARMLLCHFLKDGFEPAWIMGNIDEAWSIVQGAAKSDRKFALVYDDFLGQLEFSSKRFEKNEDQSLFMLMEKVSRTENLRLVMTTREYILEDAKRVHGVFASKADEIIKCTLSLGDYSESARGKVLFNHLYFSDLPDSRMTKLLNTRAYKNIIKHRHFNPRVVESISKNANSHLLNDDEFIKFIEHEFENPAKLWEHPFNQEISHLSRQLLVALWSFGRATTLQELQLSAESMNESIAPEMIDKQFKDSIRQIDGNFILTDRLSKAWHPNEKKYNVANFQNPSVREFVQKLVMETPAWLLRVSQTIHNFDQVDEILSAAEKLDCDSLNPSFWLALRGSAARTQKTKRKYEINCGLTKGGFYAALATEDQTHAHVTNILLRIEKRLSLTDERNTEVMARVLTLDWWLLTLTDMNRSYRARGQIEYLFTWLVDDSEMDNKILQDIKKAFTLASTQFLNSENGATDDLWNIRTLADTLELANKDLSQEILSLIHKAITSSIDSIIQDSDSDHISEQLDLLDSLSERFEIDFENEKNRVRSRLDHIKNSDEDDTFTGQPSKSYSTPQEDGIIDIDDLFKGLLDRNL
ncbi:restriction endonuclease [Pseudomonas helmanticensis]|uniref:nSTAND3 domain-containing NTPase n=1 Tax=Pseudomonas helmanticensis TaxID=1471381 RepID=UPI00381D1554